MAEQVSYGYLQGTYCDPHVKNHYPEIVATSGDKFAGRKAGQKFNYDQKGSSSGSSNQVANEDGHTTKQTGRCGLSTKKMLLIGILGLVLVCAAVIPVSIYFANKNDRQDDDNDDDYYRDDNDHDRDSDDYDDIQYGDRDLPELSRSYSYGEDKSKFTTITRLDNRTDATEPFTEVSVRCERDDDDYEKQCKVIVPILLMINSNEWDDTELDTKRNWLQEYNLNPRRFINRFIYYISRKIQIQNRRDRERVFVQEIEEEILVDVAYDNVNRNFELAQFDDSQPEEDQIDIDRKNVDRRDWNKKDNIPADDQLDINPKNNKVDPNPKPAPDNGKSTPNNDQTKPAEKGGDQAPNTPQEQKIINNPTDNGNQAQSNDQDNKSPASSQDNQGKKNDGNNGGNRNSLQSYGRDDRWDDQDSKRNYGGNDGWNDERNYRRDSQIDQSRGSVGWSDWVDSILEKTSDKLKQIVLENLNVIRTRSGNVRRQQERYQRNSRGVFNWNYNRRAPRSRWQEALVQECRTIKPRLYRCTLEGARDLIPELRGYTINQLPADAVLTYALEMKIKDYRI